VEHLCLGEQHLDVGVTEHVGQLRRCGEGRKRDGDRTHQCSAEQGRHRLRAVAHQNADPGTFACSACHQGRGDLMRLPAELGVVPSPRGTAPQGVVEDQRLVGREAGANLGEKPADRQGAHPLSLR
jgi:hypothetical protein